jgi:hypothetical protein
MKKWNDFFKESTTDEHDKAVLKSVNLLLKNQKKSFTLRDYLHNIGWQQIILATAGMTGLVLLARVFWPNSKDQNLGLITFQETLPDIAEEYEDINLLAEEDLDFEFLENLELIEELDSEIGDNA